MKNKGYNRVKRYFLPIVLIMLLIGLIVIKYADFDSNTTFKNLDDQGIQIGQESCLNCHEMTSGFSKYHNPEIIGCISCHLGNGQERNKDKSHEGMVLIPGNLSNASETCGKCHPGELSKVNNSLMTTNSGIVAVDKFIFGEADTPDDHYHIKSIKETASEKHLRDLCANCHLGADKNEFGEINQLSRGGGCIACHLNYSSQAKSDLAGYMKTDKKQVPKVHPSTDIFIGDIHCFGCHSRSSRISTNYEGWRETLLEEVQVKDKEGYRILEDLRVYAQMDEDVHHAKGMLCIDCHSSHEVMGDGKLYTHEEQAVKLQCSDCHFKDSPETIDYTQLDNESLLVFMHREYSHTDKQILIAKKDKHPLVNTYVDEDGKAYLIGKKDGKLHELKPQSQICSRDNAHKNVSCSTCHSSWTNKCIGCHNVFDKDDKDGFDLLTKKDVTGQWIEHVAEFSASLPSLGVRNTENGAKIEPAIPGMIMTVDHGSFESKSGQDISFHRLYAPNSPHTTTKKVRDCKSCHSNPEALGFGSGELVYKMGKGTGTWDFIPAYALNSYDDLPEDAWVGFLNGKNQNKTNTTRTDFRPFTVKEQQKMLEVGACLQCHSDNSKVMQNSLENYIRIRKNLKKECILPNWEIGLSQ